MIDLYTWSTPNGRKVSIMLEECGLPYRTHKVDIGKGDQFREEFVSINPNSKIPAIWTTRRTERQGAGFESGAILIYLCESQTVPACGHSRKYKALQWLMFRWAASRCSARRTISARREGSGPVRD